MNDSICKCFTGRISRLINCLNGFDELVSIKIADNKQIAQVINITMNQLKLENKYDVNLHRLLVVERLEEMKYDKHVIDEWVIHIV
jgi:hypothetical protein